MLPETILTLGDQGFLADPKPIPPRCCQWCSQPAEVYDVDGSWCSPEHRDMDRQSETTVWRRWSQ